MGNKNGAPLPEIVLKRMEGKFKTVMAAGQYYKAGTYMYAGGRP